MMSRARTAATEKSPERFLMGQFRGKNAAIAA